MTIAQERTAATPAGVVPAALAGLAGIAAAIAPSRRAVRLNVLHAVTTE